MRSGAALMMNREVSASSNYRHISALGDATQRLSAASMRVRMCVNAFVSNVDPPARGLLGDEAAVVDLAGHAAFAVPSPIVDQHVRVVNRVGHVEEREREVEL